MKESLRRSSPTHIKEHLRRKSRGGIKEFLRPQAIKQERSVSAPIKNPAMPSSSTKRFELPALAPLESLTQGTNIPAPPDSPIEEKPPATFPVSAQQSTTSPASKTSINTNNENRSPNSNNLEPPVSPTSTKPSSIRRFLSRKSLNQSYNNGNASVESLSTRPESPATFSTNNSGTKRKSRGNWLRRLVGGGSSDKSISGGKRTSTVFEVLAEQENGDQSPPPAKRLNGGSVNGNGVRKVVDMGPPAPKLPELNQFKAKVDETTGSLGGGDMFAGIGK